MPDEIKIKESTTKRIGGYLHKVIPIVDKTGDVLSYVLKPIMVEFKPRDIFQVVIGASMLAIPVSLTEEAWNLGQYLPKINIALIGLLSVSFISAFIFFNFYRYNLKGNVLNFVKRIIGTYFISFVVVALLLTLIDKCPWGIDNVLALKRIVLVAFPAAMSGTLSDTIK